ncbi:Uncharacterized protein APZ42_025014 [Daphnia magna]|uniref:Uncharacterized protein n=1 Tax=Daphnia magna TaxID=35525 RepID=A0A164TJG4_9CRUS|nr:Uncharacterized protein APZ42_025014 [Daphnia magna]
MDSSKQLIKQGKILADYHYTNEHGNEEFYLVIECDYIRFNRAIFGKIDGETKPETNKMADVEVEKLVTDFKESWSLELMRITNQEQEEPGFLGAYQVQLKKPVTSVTGDNTPTTKTIGVVWDPAMGNFLFDPTQK